LWACPPVAIAVAAAAATVPPHSQRAVGSAAGTSYSLSVGNDPVPLLYSTIYISDIHSNSQNSSKKILGQGGAGAQVGRWVAPPVNKMVSIGENK